jgi:hypothetical protein
VTARFAGCGRSGAGFTTGRQADALRRHHRGRHAAEDGGERRWPRPTG